jgi:DNA polymerase-3 subunit beta
MKFKINTHKLSLLLANVRQSISVKIPSVALMGVKIDLSDSRLTLTGSDYDNSVITYLEKGDDLIIEEPGQALINANIFYNTISTISSPFIQIEQTELTSLNIIDEKGITQLNLLTYEDYPELDLNAGGESFSISSDELKKVIEQTGFSILTNKDSRPVMSGYFFKAHDGVLDCCTTDNYRFSRKTIPLNDNINFHIIIPQRTLQIVKNISSTDGTIYFTTNEVQLKITYGTTTVYSRLIVGMFPDIGAIIPGTFDKILDAKTSDLLQGITRVDANSSETNKVMKITLKENNVELSSFDREIGFTKYTLEDAIYTGEEYSLYTNVKFFLQAIKALEHEDAVIKFANNASFISNRKDDSNLQIVFSVRH